MGTTLFASIGFDVPNVWRHDNNTENLLAPALPLTVDSLACDALCARYGQANTQAASALLLRILAVVPGFERMPYRDDFAHAALRAMLAANTVSLVKPHRAFQETPVFARLEDAVVWFSDQIDIDDPSRLVTGLIHFIRRVGLRPHIDSLRRYVFDPTLRDTGYVHQALQIFLSAPKRCLDENISLSRLLCSSYFNPHVEQTFPETFYCALLGLPQRLRQVPDRRHKLESSDVVYRNWWQSLGHS